MKNVEHFGDLTPRMNQYREAVLDKKPYIDAQRALLCTEAYRANQNQPAVMKRALMLKNILEKMTIYIEDQTVIVGNQASSNKDAPIFPEYTLDFVLDELDTFEKRDGDVFYITQQTKDQLRSIAPFWQNNNLRARGQVQLGEKTYVFDPADSFGVLDWGRGVWTYHNTWYWGSASGQVEGVPFGWNIGYGFGDTSAASENMLFYGGKAHKLSQVRFHIPQREGRDDFLSPWRFTSDDGRFEMKFVPILDRAACTDVKLIKSDQHQVFGRFTGTATLDDGTVIRVRDMIGFAEKVENKW